MLVKQNIYVRNYQYGNPYYKYKPSRETLRKHGILNNSRKMKILITRPDKGSGVVILDRETYDSGIKKLISDQNNLKTIKKMLLSIVKDN